jgi:hypothetical protein
MGCEGYRETIRGLGSSGGAIQAHDIQSAAKLREALPDFLQLPNNLIRVEPGSGVIYVTLSGLHELAERQTLLDKLKQFQMTHPDIEPIKVRFQD